MWDIFVCLPGGIAADGFGSRRVHEDYFNENRYQILCNRSLGHSVPLINDCEQCPGKTSQADAFVWDEEKETLTISFAGAYPEGCIDRVTRVIAKERTCGEHLGMALSVTDCFIPSGQNNQNYRKPDHPVSTGSGTGQ